MAIIKPISILAMLASLGYILFQLLELGREDIALAFVTLVYAVGFLSVNERE